MPDIIFKFCHHCHAKKECLKCDTCPKAYCGICITKYDTTLETIRQLYPSDPWSCFACKNQCHCAQCSRRRLGVTTTGTTGEYSSSSSSSSSINDNDGHYDTVSPSPPPLLHPTATNTAITTTSNGNPNHNRTVLPPPSTTTTSTTVLPLSFLSTSSTVPYITVRRNSGQSGIGTTTSTSPPVLPPPSKKIKGSTTLTSSSYSSSSTTSTTAPVVSSRTDNTAIPIAPVHRASAITSSSSSVQQSSISSSSFSSSSYTPPTPEQVQTILYANGNYRLEVLALNPHAKPFVPARHDHASSSYRGVSLPQNGRWRARICIDKQEYTIGDYGSELEAAHAYDIESIKNYKLKYLNFIYRGINDRTADNSYDFSRNPTIRYVNSLQESVVREKLIATNKFTAASSSSSSLSIQHDSSTKVSGSTTSKERTEKISKTGTVKVSKKKDSNSNQLSHTTTTATAAADTATTERTNDSSSISTVVPATNGTMKNTKEPIVHHPLPVTTIGSTMSATNATNGNASPPLMVIDWGAVAPMTTGKTKSNDTGRVSSTVKKKTDRSRGSSVTDSSRDMDPHSNHSSSTTSLSTVVENGTHYFSDDYDTRTPYLALQPVHKPIPLIVSSVLAADGKELPSVATTKGCTGSTGTNVGTLSSSSKARKRSLDSLTNGTGNPTTLPEALSLGMDKRNIMNEMTLPLGRTFPLPPEISLNVRPGRGRPRKDGLPNKSSIERIVNFMGGMNTDTNYNRDNNDRTGDENESTVRNTTLGTRDRPYTHPNDNDVSLSSATHLYNLTNMYTEYQQVRTQNHPHTVPLNDTVTDTFDSNDNQEEEDYPTDTTRTVNDTMMDTVNLAIPTYISHSRPPPSNTIGATYSYPPRSSKKLKTEGLSILPTGETSSQEHQFVTGNNGGSTVSGYTPSSERMNTFSTTVYSQPSQQPITQLTPQGYYTYNNNVTNYHHHHHQRTHSQKYGLFSPSSHLSIQDVFNDLTNTNNNGGNGDSSSSSMYPPLPSSLLSSTSSFSSSSNSASSSLFHTPSGTTTTTTTGGTLVNENLVLLDFFSQPFIALHFSPTQQYKIRNLIVTGGSYIIDLLRQAMNMYIMNPNIAILLSSISNIYQIWYTMGKSYGIIDELPTPLVQNTAYGGDKTRMVNNDEDNDRSKDNNYYRTVVVTNSMDVSETSEVPSSPRVGAEERNRTTVEDGFHLVVPLSSSSNVSQQQPFSSSVATVTTLLSRSAEDRTFPLPPVAAISSHPSASPRSTASKTNTDNATTNQLNEGSLNSPC